MDNLRTSFGKQKINKNQKTTMIQNIFSNVSNKYDLMNDLMSFGMHRLWKRRFVEIMNIQKNDKIIDVGSGTGDLVKIISSTYQNVFITSVDLNTEMLKLNKKRNKKNNNKIKWINCNAEKLPFKNDSFDKYATAFCIRNITFINQALNEALRILKPGGTFYCLEFSSPQLDLLSKIYKLYKKNIIPNLGNIITKNQQAYIYLEESIDKFPNQDIFETNLKASGFVNTQYINLFNGIVSIHIGNKV